MQSRQLKYYIEVCIAVNGSALMRQRSLTSAVRLMVMSDPIWGRTEWFDEIVLIFLYKTNLFGHKTAIMTA